eukprot:scaffold69012_cov35-Tisochrysis_lutea.AAC.1
MPPSIERKYVFHMSTRPRQPRCTIERKAFSTSSPIQQPGVSSPDRSIGTSSTEQDATADRGEGGSSIPPSTAHATAEGRPRHHSAAGHPIQYALVAESSEDCLLPPRPSARRRGGPRQTNAHLRIPDSTLE